MQTQALAQNERCVGDIETLMQLRPRRSLDTMVGPERLRTIACLDRLKGVAPNVRRSKGTVFRRMPVLGQNNMFEVTAKSVDGCKHFVAMRHRKKTALAEIVLEIDDQKDVVRSN